MYFMSKLPHTINERYLTLWPGWIKSQTIRFLPESKVYMNELWSSTWNFAYTPVGSRLQYSSHPNQWCAKTQTPSSNICTAQASHHTQELHPTPLTVRQGSYSPLLFTIPCHTWKEFSTPLTGMRMNLQPTPDRMQTYNLLQSLF